MHRVTTHPLTHSLSLSHTHTHTHTSSLQVYSFGITLWELYMALRPYEGVPRAVLGHLIAYKHKRPAFPPDVPTGYKHLTEQCWAPDPKQRPSFMEVGGRCVCVWRWEGGVCVCGGGGEP
jgi:hypothetical protein